MTWRERARAIAGFLPDCLVLIRRLYADASTPRRHRVLLLLLLGYLVSPIDLIPDFLPGIGQLDDAVLVAVVLRVVLRDHNAARLREAWPGPERSLRVVLAAAGRS